MKRILPLAAATLLVACGGDTTPDTSTTATDSTVVATTDTVQAAVVALVITEHAIDDVSLVRAHHQAQRAGSPVDTTAHTRPYETALASDLAAVLVLDSILPTDTLPATTPVGPPLMVAVAPIAEVDNTLLVAYEKKGVEVLQVSVDAADPEQVLHVVFMSKDHMDEYDVRPGMKGAEARKLRRELKHMVHKGQVFLYAEDSNITYRMAVTDGTKVAYTDAEVDELGVEAIVWRNKHARRTRKGKA